MGPTSLLLSSDGWLYGSSVRGSSYPGGALYRVRPDGSDFKPIAAAGENAYFTLCVAGDDGSVFGIRGGQKDRGQQGDIVKIAPDGSISVLAEAGDEAQMGPFVDGADGFFYGNMQNGPYRVAKGGGSPKLLHRFTRSPMDGQLGIDWYIWPPTPIPDHRLIGQAEGGKNGAGIIYHMNRDGSDHGVQHLEAEDGKTVRRIVGSHGNDVYALVYATQAIAAGGQADLVRLKGERTEAVATLPLIPNTPLAMAADGSALYGQARQQIFRINLHSVEQPLLSRAELPYHQPEPSSALLTHRKRATPLPSRSSLPPSSHRSRSSMPRKRRRRRRIRR
jgi:hypothetical protein